MRGKICGCFVTSVLVMGLLAGCKQPGSVVQSSVASEKEAEQPAQIITMTFAPAENSPHHQGAKEFARLIEEKTDGKYKVEIYPNSSLAGGNQLEAIQMVQKGSISCGFLSPLVQTAIEPNLNALSIPWLWKSEETIDEHLQSGTEIDKHLNRLLNEKGFEIIGYAENGYREMTNNVREIRNPDDMKNLKFRVIGSPLLLNTFKAMGANPVDLNFGELFTALSQNTVDGQENPISTIIIPQRFYEAQKYLTLWNYSYEPHPLEFNKQLWDSFSPETQKIFKECASEACEVQKKAAREAMEKDIKTIEDAGVTVTILTDEEVSVFKEKADPVIAKELQNYDQALVKTLYDANK